MDVEADEDLEDFDPALKEVDPYWNCSIKRKIGGWLFRGKVEDIELGKISRVEVYRVKYENGDLSEHLLAAEIEEHMVRHKSISVHLVRVGDTLIASFFNMAGDAVGAPCDLQINDTVANLCECMRDQHGHPSVKIYNGSDRVHSSSGLAKFKTLTAIIATTLEVQKRRQARTEGRAAKRMKTAAAESKGAEADEDADEEERTEEATEEETEEEAEDADEEEGTEEAGEEEAEKKKKKKQKIQRMITDTDDDSEAVD